MFSSAFIEHFHFLRPWWGLLLLPTALLLWQQWRQRDGGPAWQTIIAPHLLQALRIRQFRNHWFNPVSVAALFMLLTTVILMGPSWRQQVSPLARDEAALVIVLDASASMGQRDVQPSRLQRAKQKVADLLLLRTGSRTALIAFAGSAHTVLTLSDDAQILAQYLQAIDTSIMPRSGKFAEYALPQIDTLVSDFSIPTTVLLITDGVSSDTQAAYSEWFAQRPHQLLVWGIGLDAVDAQSEYAPLETAALRELADSASGRYITLSIDQTDVRDIQRRIEAHYVVSSDNAVPWLDSGYMLVFPCLLLFSLWFRRGWTLHWGLALMLSLGALQPQTAQASDNWFADLWLTPDQQGRILLQQGDYREAAQRFQNPLWKAVAYYYAQEFNLAAEYFSRADTPLARFNRANALAHGQNYVMAVRIYQQLLLENPQHGAADRNRQMVQDLIDAINAMSESQADEGGPDSSNELGEDDPLRAQGAERDTMTNQEQLQFDAEEILQDSNINDMWMRSVQRDPAHFLAVKFSMQLENRDEQP